MKELIKDLSNFWFLKKLSLESENYYIRTQVTGRTNFSWFIGCEDKLGVPQKIEDLNDEDKLIQLEKEFQERFGNDSCKEYNGDEKGKHIFINQIIPPLYETTM
jgi:hypothetical protein